MDDIEAKISLNWGIRMLLAGIAFLGFGLWSLYDGVVKYPGIEETFQTFLEDHRVEQWVPYARENDLPSEYHTDSATGKRYIKSEWDIRTQYIMAAICLPIGILVLGRLLLMMPKRLKADDEAIETTDGTRIPYHRITEVNRDKWDRKGIAVVYFEDENGTERRTKIDDWIFKGGKDILRAIEEHVPPDISGLEPMEEEDDEGSEANADAGDAADSTPDDTAERDGLS